MTEQDFFDVDEKTLELFNEIKTEHFMDLRDAEFQVIFRTKRKGNDDNLVVAEICKLNNIAKFLSTQIPEVDDCLNYIIVIDKNVWNCLEDEDKFRVLFHELCHCDVQFKDDGTINYGLRDYTIKSFFEAVSMEQREGGDPKWKDRVSMVGVSIYDEIKEREKAEKKKNKTKK